MDHAFTDQMVREDRESLTEAVYAYLLQYRGNFQVVKDAARTVAKGEDLNVAQIRTILNVMRADTAVQMEYTPPRTNNVVEFPRRGVFHQDAHLGNVVRRLELPVRGRLKLPYATSTGIRAEVIHEINLQSVAFVFKRSGAQSLKRSRGWEQLWHDRIEFDFRHLCGSRPNHNTAWLLSEADALQMIRTCQRRRCPGCVRVANA